MQTRFTLCEEAKQLLRSVDGRVRFNKAIENGAEVFLCTSGGVLKVKFVDKDWNYHIFGDPFGKVWRGRNDVVWEDLLRQAGVEKETLFSN